MNEQHELLPVSAPAAKKAARKAPARKTAASPTAAAAPAPAPAPVVAAAPSAPAVVAKKAARKVAKKAAPVSEAPAPAHAPAPAPAPRVEAAPVVHERPVAAERAPQPQDDAARAPRPQSRPPREPRPQREPRPPREPRPQAEARPQPEGGEAREPRPQAEPRPQREPREAREPREPRQPRPENGPRPQGETSDLREARPSGQPQQHQPRPPQPQGGQNGGQNNGQNQGNQQGNRRMSRWERRRQRHRERRDQARQGGGGNQAGPVEGGEPNSIPPQQGQPNQTRHGNHPNQRQQRGDNRHNDRDRHNDRRNQQRQPQGADLRDQEMRPEPIPTGPAEPGEGLLEISGKGFGFLRQKHRSYAQAPTDIFVTPEIVRNYGLRDGMILEGDVRLGSRGPQLTDLRTINGQDPEKYRNLPIFEELTAINPTKRVILETDPNRATTRIIDMVSPIGRGQRGLIVAPPRTGKTTLLQHIAEAVAQNHPAMHLIILLVDERPEEVTEITRSLPKGEIFASSNDADVKSHIRIATIAIERAKRLVEAGEDVFIVLDSITRLARAFNNSLEGRAGSGRTMKGGIDARALELPRKLFAAARNTREGGSLTIIATALIETNSKADDLIFQEFKGTGNMELVLDRKISQSYVYPAVDIFKSGTRREELLLPAHQLEKINLIRRGLAGHKPVEAVERLLHFIRRHPNNAQMLINIPKGSVD